MLGTVGEAQGIDLPTEAPFSLGGASIDPGSREATFNGSTERIQPQNLKVLIALAQRRGQLVGRDELIRRCWDGRVIGDDVINRAISTLRQFAERAGGFAIETVPRSGYRLVEHRNRDRSSLLLAAAGLVALTGAAFTIHQMRAEQSAAPATLSVAVLPFQTSDGDPAGRKIAFAAHDSMTNALSQTRFAVVQPTGTAIRQQRQADFLISADVTTGPSSTTITVQMVEAAHNTLVYSHRFSAENAKAWSLAEMTGPEVASSFGWMAPILLADHRYPSDPRIFADLFQQTDLQEVGWLNEYERTRRVAQSAPNSAVAQYALASSVGSDLPGLPRDQRAEAVAAGRAAERRAESLAPDLGDTQMTWCLLHSRARMIECEDRLRDAMRRDPGSPWVDYNLADRLKDAGRMAEALGLAQHSLAADEFIAIKIALTLRMLEATGQADDAERLYQSSRRWWPANRFIIWDRVYGIIDRGDFDALERFRNEVAHDDDPNDWRENLQQDFGPVPLLREIAKSGDVARARRTCALDQPASFKRDLCLLAFERLGDEDDAMALALRTFPDRVGRSPADEERIFLDAPWVIDTDIITGSSSALLRRDPRYLELARRLGLLSYWQSGRLPDFCRPRTAEPICSKLKTGQ